MSVSVGLAASVAGEPACPVEVEPLPLLLVEDDGSTGRRLQKTLTTAGFVVTVADRLELAEELAAEHAFAFAVVDLRLQDGHGLTLVKTLQQLKSPPRIIVISGYDSFAGTILALRAGAADYLPKPINEAELVRALRGERLVPEIPATLLSPSRIVWEHVQRIFEQCDRNVSETARRLGMHRRTLQRMIAKRAPPRH